MNIFKRSVAFVIAAVFTCAFVPLFAISKLGEWAFDTLDATDYHD